MEKVYQEILTGKHFYVYAFTTFKNEVVVILWHQPSPKQTLVRANSREVRILNIEDFNILFKRVCDE